MKKSDSTRGNYDTLVLKSYHKKIQNDVRRYSMNYLSNVPIIIIGTLIILATNINSFSDLYYYQKLWFGILSMIICSLVSIVVLKKISVSIVDLLVVIYITYSCINMLTCSTIPPDPLIIAEWIMLVLIYLCVRLACKHNAWQLIILIILSGLFQAIWGIMQFCGFIESQHMFLRVTGDFMNPGPWGGYLSICISLALAYVANHDLKRNLFYFFWITILVMLVALVISNSRAAWLSLMIVGAYIIFTRLKTEKNKIRFLRYIVLLLLPVLIFLYKYKEGSADGRLFIWKISTNMILEKPICGHGIQSFPSKYMLHQGEYIKQNISDSKSIEASNNYYAFNEFIHVIVEQGIIGLILFLLIITLVFLKKGDMTTKSGLTALLVFSFFSYPSDVLPLKICYPLFIGILSESSHKIHPSTKFNIAYMQIAVLVVLLSLLGFIYIQKSKFDKAYGILEVSPLELLNMDDREYTKGLMANDRFYVGTYSKVLFDYKQYGRSLPFMEQISVFRPSSIVFCELGDIYKNLKFYSKAEKYYTNALFMTPGYITPPFRLFKLYLDTDDQKKAIEMAQYIIKMNVKVTNSVAIKYRNDAKEYLRSINNKNDRN